jgi:hypothetical protein
MTRDEDFIGQLEGYLDEYEGLTPLPDAISNAVRAQLPKTRQIGPLWGPMRYLNMSISLPGPVRYGLVAAVVVLAAIGVGALLPRITGRPTATPTATPTPSPTPPELMAGEQLKPGTYSLSVLGLVNATITVPSGWVAYDHASVNKNGLDNASITAVIFWDADPHDRVYADPCHWSSGFVDPPVGKTIDDLATALADQPDRGDAMPIDVSIDGYRGQMIELSVPSDIRFADCDGGQFRTWEGRYHQGPGQIDQIYILDVGGHRLVIDTFFMPATSEGDRAERQAIVDSIQLSRP